MLRGSDFEITAPLGSPLYDAQLSLQRLQPVLQRCWELAQLDSELAHSFESRLVVQWPRLFDLLRRLDGRPQLGGAFGGSPKSRQFAAARSGVVSIPTLGRRRVVRRPV
jgi:hypothetical protein